jgi:hypothetical protein
MGPAWGNDLTDRDVACQGPVGARWLGRSRYFRYQVRLWRDGVIPDVAEAVDSPQRLTTHIVQAQALLGLVPAFPTETWGRDDLGTGDMWNSNSLTSWLLAGIGLDADQIRPPTRRTRARMDRRGHGCPPSAGRPAFSCDAGRRPKLRSNWNIGDASLDEWMGNALEGRAAHDATRLSRRDVTAGLAECASTTCV